MVVDYLAGLVAVVFLGLGAIGLLTPVRSFRRLLRSRRTALADVGEGLVAVHGTATQRTETVEAPLTGEPCLGYVVDQELRYRSGKHVAALRKTWRRERALARVVPFGLADGTATLRVEPDNVERDWRTPIPGDWSSDVRLRRTSRQSFPPTEDAPDHIRELFGAAEPSAFAVIGGSSVPHRYTEWRLDPGVDLFVTGTVTTEDGQPVLRHPVGDEFLVDRSEASLRSFYGLLVIRWFIAVGLLVIGGGILWFVF